jgi:hypothetical protein
LARLLESEAAESVIAQEALFFFRGRRLAPILGGQLPLSLFRLRCGDGR